MGSLCACKCHVVGTETVPTLLEEAFLWSIPTSQACYSESQFYYFLAWHLLPWAGGVNLSPNPRKRDYGHGSTGRFSFSTMNYAAD